MKFASLTQRISPTETLTADPWEVHNLAMQRIAIGEDVTLLSVGQEADETTPQAVIASAVSSLQNGDHHYTDVRGSDELRACIARYHKSLTNQVVSAEQCTVYSGAQNALFAVALALLEPGCDVIVPEPYYTTYEATFSASGATLIKIPVKTNQCFALDIAAIKNKFSSRTRALILNSPNNPLGTCYTKAQFEQLVQLCKQFNSWLILDMVYLDVVEHNKLALPHHIKNAEKLLISVGSLSKSHRMTGWRMGWVVGPTKLAEHLANLSMAMHYGLPPFIMAAAITAIENATDTPRTVQSMLQRRRRIVQETLIDLSPVSLIDSGQGMFMLLDVSNIEPNAHEFALHLLTHYRVAVLPCSGFGKTGEQLVRIGLCVDDDKLRGACRQIVQCVKELSPKRTS